MNVKFMVWLVLAGCSDPATPTPVRHRIHVSDPVPVPHIPVPVPHIPAGARDDHPEGWCPEPIAPDPKTLKGSTLCMGPKKPECHRVSCDRKVTYEAILEPYSTALWFHDQLLENPITTVTFVKSDLVNMRSDFSENVCDAFWTKVTFKNGKTALIHRESSWLESDFSNCHCQYLIDSDFKRECVNWGAK